MTTVELIALAASTSLLAGWRLYLVTLITGIGMKFGWIALPDQLQALDVLANNWVLAIAAVGKEFGEGADRSRPDHPRAGDDVQCREMVGQGDPAELHRYPGDQRDEIEAPAGEQAGRCGEGDDFRRRHERRPSVGRNSTRA